MRAQHHQMASWIDQATGTMQARLNSLLFWKLLCVEDCVEFLCVEQEIADPSSDTAWTLICPLYVCKLLQNEAPAVEKMRCLLSSSCWFLNVSHQEPPSGDDLSALDKMAMSSKEVKALEAWLPHIGQFWKSRSCSLGSVEQCPL